MSESILAIYGVTIFLCCVGALVKPRTKIAQLVVLGLIAFMMGRGAITADTINYYNSYLAADAKGFVSVYEPGFLLLMKAGVMLGADYVQFRLAVVFLALLLVANVANKIAGRNVFYFYLFYCFFLIFIDTVQVRSFLAFSIVVHGIGCLVFSKKRCAIPAYIFFVVLASTIHISSLAYLVLCFLRFKERRVLVKVSCLLSLIICFLLFFGGGKLDLIWSVISLLPDDEQRLSSYGVGEVSWGFLYAFSLQLISILALFLMRGGFNKECRLLGEGSTQSASIKYLIDIALWMNLLAVVYFPLYMFNLQFIRLERSLLVVTLMFVSMLFVRYTYIRYQKIFLWCSVLVMNSLWFMYTFLLSDNFERVVIPFFQADTVLTAY